MVQWLKVAFNKKIFCVAVVERGSALQKGLIQLLRIALLYKTVGCEVVESEFALQDMI